MKSFTTLASCNRTCKWHGFAKCVADWSLGIGTPTNSSITTSRGPSRQRRSSGRRWRRWRRRCSTRGRSSRTPRLRTCTIRSRCRRNCRRSTPNSSAPWTVLRQEVRERPRTRRAPFPTLREARHPAHCRNRREETPQEGRSLLVPPFQGSEKCGGGHREPRAYAAGLISAAPFGAKRNQHIGAPHFWSAGVPPASLEPTGDNARLRLRPGW